MLLQNSHPGSSEKNQVSESQLHGEVDEQSSPPLQLIHYTLRFGAEMERRKLLSYLEADKTPPCAVNSFLKVRVFTG